MIDLCVFFLYPTTLPRSLTNLGRFFIESLVFSILDNPLSSVNRDSLVFFPFWICTVTSFSYLIAVART